MSFNYDEIGQQWIAIWNEADETARQAQASKIWTSDARHFAPGFEGNGLDAIRERLNAVYNRFIKQADCVIRHVDSVGFGDALRVLWEIAPRSGGPAIMKGSEILMLNKAGTVRLDYQFVDPQAKALG
jgi:hypothetical protein